VGYNAVVDSKGLSSFV